MKRMKRITVIATVAAVAAVAVAGGGTAIALADDAGDRTEKTAVRDAKVTAAQAIEAALQAQPGTAVSADLDDDDRGWEVDVLGTGTTSYTVHVDAGTGKVLGKETDRDDDDRDDADDRRALKGASVDAREAAEAASVKGAVTSVSLDDDDRAPAAWDVDTVNGDWRVDPKTAQVTPDDDGQDDRDDDRAGAAGRADDRADDADGSDN
ncbi:MULTISPECIES: PepSY domain-containing protein [unclassified Streptomyces]|uniref:PepSY domain-containing protein n=1 Tax=Streptomyces sp. NPDC127129 TaxID=3345373 RepID=UPI0036333B2C